MNQRPFSIPLDLSQFTSALQKGQGRVKIHARAVGLHGFEAAIVDACLHDWAYDPQCEADRTGWLMDLVAMSGADVVQELIPQLNAPTERFWDAAQRCRIARELAQRGYPEARSRLYRCLRKWPDSADVLGAEDIIVLDGADGFLHVAEFFGTLLQQEPGIWADEGPLRWFDEAHGAGSGRRLLDAASVHTPLVASYLRHLDERDSNKQNASKDTSSDNGYLSLANVQLDVAGGSAHVARMRKISAVEVVRDIEMEDPQQNRFWYSTWGRHAPTEELLAVFEAMISQSEPGRLCKYLRVFGRRPLPAFDPRMLQYAENPDAELRRLAIRALSNYAHGDVRQLAVERLNAGRYLEGELKLLKANYRQGDAALIEPVLPLPKCRDELHGLVFELVELFEANKITESTTAMLFVYEESPCSNCRCKAVKVLADTGQLPDWLAEESRDDSSDEVRMIANNMV